MKRRTISPIRSTVKAASGGALAVAAIIALLFFRGSGFGEAEEASDSPGDSGSEMTSLDPTVTPSEDNTKPPSATENTEATEADQTAGLTPDEKKALSSDVLAVLIDERDFLLAVPSDTGTVYQPMTIQRAGELAALAPGDSNGIRVRILRRETARASAEQELKAELGRLGISSDALFMPAEFIP